jgi:hypothetical protein
MFRLAKFLLTGEVFLKAHPSVSLITKLRLLRVAAKTRARLEVILHR